MGINISAWKINGIEEVNDTYPDCLYTFFKKEKIPYWDICRYSGDKDFWMTDDLEWETRYEGDVESKHSFDETYHRPKDLDKAIEWVKNEIYIGNQKRWIEILDNMKTDKDIYLTCSW